MSVILRRNGVYDSDFEALGDKCAGDGTVWNSRVILRLMPAASKTLSTLERP